ncbi:MAG: polysulfide reductase NrfD, partial [Rhodospirillales bacterium]|nr:polysulfide reductase NrfD [Rhodospirillales bacterium]
MIIAELGQPYRALNLFKVINLSPMSVGSWLLLVFINVSLVYAFLYLPWGSVFGRWQAPLRRGLAWVCVPLGIGTAIYTGVMLGAMPARPFWNSPVLALLFFISALSTGVAVIILAQALTSRKGMDSYTIHQ